MPNELCSNFIAVCKDTYNKTQNSPVTFSVFRKTRSTKAFNKAFEHDHMTLIMGRGRSWTPAECLHLAEAWLDVSQDVGEREVKGTWQDSSQFWSKVMAVFSSKCPVDNPDGVYGDRALSAVKGQWKEKIARGCRNFNKALLVVLNSRPTGCNEQNKINMAVAIQLGKTSRMDYIFKDFQANDWPYYSCWMHLKGNRAFLPPSPPTAENMVHLDEEEEDEVPVDAVDDPSEITNATDIDNTAEATPARTAVAPAILSPSGSRSRGPGPGSKKTKKQAEENDYRKKKAKIQEGMLEVQRQRQADFASYVNNQARASAFKMALTAYRVFIDTDPAAAEQYKAKMEDIMSLNTNGDMENNSVTDEN